MSQRVNIQYGIEMSELPTETRRLLQQSYKRLHDIDEGLHISDDVLSLTTLQEIDALRQNLAKIDYQLSDIANIISGYLKFSTSSSDDQPARPAESPIETVATLEEKLEEFKRSLVVPDADSD